MKNTSIARSVADEVLSMLTGGIPLDADAIHYLTSCEGINGKNEILTFLKDEATFLSPVYRIIIHPDNKIRLIIERIIPPRGLNSDIITEISCIVESSGAGINLFAYGEKIHLSHECFKDQLMLYIKKLNLDINTDIFPESSGDFLDERVQLRRLRFSPAGETASFLATLADGCKKIKIPDCSALFSFSLQLIGKNQEEIFQLLENKKYFYESAMRDSSEFSRILAKYSMEYVMYRKLQPPLISIEEAQSAVRNIDLITHIVYGKTIPPMDNAIDLIL